MKILLTGSTGFLVQNLEQVLSKSYEVVGVESWRWDLRDQRVCSDLVIQTKPDVIVHAAGTVGGIGANKEKPGDFFYDNIMMSTQLIHEAMKAKVEKFIALGTICSYPKFANLPFANK